MRTDVEFKAEDGVTLRGWRYRPANGSGPWPTIVMAHGFSAVKEMYLDRFAEAFAAAGLAALVFDNRNFGASDGEPRQEIDPWRQVSDYRDAISYALTLPETDRERIGVWGSSYSGAPRARGRRDRPPDPMRRLAGAADQRLSQRAPADPRRHDRAGARDVRRGPRCKRYQGGAPALLPVVSEDPAGPAALPTPDSWHWFTETGRTRAPSWRNEVTLRSVEMFLGYEPGAYIELISPTPAADGGGAGRPPDGRRRGARRLRAGAPAEEAGDPDGRPLRRLRRRLRRRERRRARLVRGAPDGLSRTLSPTAASRRRSGRGCRGRSRAAHPRLRSRRSGGASARPPRGRGRTAWAIPTGGDGAGSPSGRPGGRRAGCGPCPARGRAARRPASVGASGGAR